MLKNRLSILLKRLTMNILRFSMNIYKKSRILKESAFALL
jgi:hypothetical protein